MAKKKQGTFRRSLSENDSDDSAFGTDLSLMNRTV